MHSIYVFCDLDVTEVLSNVFTKTEIFPITQDLVLHTFPEWGPVFEISFGLWIEIIEKNDYYASVLTFTKNPGQCCGIGDRLPGIFLKTDTEHFHIGTQIGSDGNKYATSVQKYVTKKWYHFQIKQFEQSGRLVMKKTFRTNHLALCFSFLRPL